MTPTAQRPAPVRIPDLGRRGEGWVALQAVLFVLVIAAGLAGPQWEGLVRIVGILGGLVLLGGGVALIGGGIVGLRSQLTAFPKPVEDGELIEDGAFGLVRHPMYGGSVLVAVGWGLVTASLPTLLFAVVLALFLDLKSRREEAWLDEDFPTYAGYRSRTPRLIPRIH